METPYEEGLGIGAEKTPHDWTELPPKLSKIVGLPSWKDIDRKEGYRSKGRSCGERWWPTITEGLEKAAPPIDFAGYREIVFAIIGVKVYVANLYANLSIFKELSSWVGNSLAETKEGLFGNFSYVGAAPLEKSLQIVLVRDVDGETLWNALSDVVSPKLKKQTPVDESALATFSGIFEGRPLKKGTRIYLTWLKPSKMLVSVSSDGTPTRLDGQVMSLNVTKALFDVFFGNSSVSPTLKDSVPISLKIDLQ